MANVWKKKAVTPKAAVNNITNAAAKTLPVVATTLPANNKLKTTVNQNIMNAQATAPKPTNTGGIAPINFDQYKTQSASVADISKKYGLDYSREYAQRQAEAAAQAKRSGLKNQEDKINQGVTNAQDALSRDYFQKGLMQAQSQVNNGLNGGLANEGNLRLSMNRQAEMGDIMGEANMARNDVAQQLTDVEVSRKAMEEEIYNTRMQEAIALIQQDRSLDQNEKQAMMNAMLQQRGQDIDMSQFQTQQEWEKYMFNNVSATDKASQDWQKYMFNNISATDKSQSEWQKYIFNNMSASDRANLDWSKYQFNNQSADQQAQNKLAWAQLEEEKKQFASEQEWRKYQHNNMSASEKAQLAENKKQFGEEMAWRMYEMEYTAEMSLAEAGAGLDFLP